MQAHMLEDCPPLNWIFSLMNGLNQWLFGKEDDYLGKRPFFSR